MYSNSSVGAYLLMFFMCTVMGSYIQEPLGTGNGGTLGTVESFWRHTSNINKPKPKAAARCMTVY